MQWEKPRNNPKWDSMSEKDRETARGLLSDTIQTDFRSFQKHLMALEDASVVENVWPYLPDLPLWTLAQMACDYSNSPEQWNNRYEYSAMKKGILPFVKFWEERLRTESLPPVDYAYYHEHFLCSEPTETDDEVLGWDFDEKRKRRGQRFRKVDRRLFICVSRFDYEGAEKALQEGANMDARCDGDMQSAWFRIRSELGYLGSCGNFLTHSTNYDSLCDFIGQAAHQKMMDLFVKYDK